MTTTLPSLESRDLAEWTQIEDQESDQNEEERDQRRKEKGKSKDIEFRGFDAEIGVAQLDEMPTEDVSPSYPPTSEEAAEEREIIDNLKRWEATERLRRKAARESRSMSGGSSVSSPITELSRRASQLIFRRSNDSKRDGASRLRTDSPTALDDLEQQRHSLTRIDTADTARNPFRDSAAAESDPSLVLMTSPKPVRHERMDSTSTVAAENALHQPTPQRLDLQTPNSSTFLVTNGTHKVPPPRPLDIPTTPAPQHVYEGGDPAPARTSKSRDMKIRRTLAEVEEEEDEIERERRDGRWWTDWLCGLKERRDPAGQGGRTNPFE